MITQQDLQAAIAECQGVTNPNANTCIKLASFMTIYDHMFKEEAEKAPGGYSFASDGLNVVGTSEFISVVNGKDTEGIFAILDELMDALLVLNPRLYNSVMQKLREVG